MRSTLWITKASTFKECHDNIHTYFPKKKICQGGYLWSLEEDNQICKVSLCSSDSRFYSLHQMLQLWIVNYDSSGSKNFIPSSENSLTRSYSSSELIAIKYYLEYPYNSTDLVLNVTSITDASIILMTRYNDDQAILKYEGFISNIGTTNYQLIGLFSSVVLLYKPNSESSSATFKLSWSNTSPYNPPRKPFPYLKVIYFGVALLMFIDVIFVLWFIHCKRKKTTNKSEESKSEVESCEIELKPNENAIDNVGFEEFKRNTQT